MKNLQPYWFLQNPIDAEHKYYVLMDFLQSVEKDLDQKKYSEQIQKITRVYNDIKNFQKYQIKKLICESWQRNLILVSLSVM